ncbi:DUF4080 domain-containing protein (plasmid) [Lachnospiraceae bacterium C1.1]|nr:DUF4080 domain-containing protein [Lachnospiraceae bacterium C1.1]
MSREQILLVALNAKYIHSNPAVYSLAAYANQITDNVSIAEFTINDRYEDILGGILMKKPDVIGFSIYIWNVELMKQLIEDIHKISPKIRLMAGGPEATNDPETYLEWCELVMLGEGEKNFRKIADCIKKQVEIPFEEMDGIAYKNPEPIIHFQGQNSILAMDQIPFLYKSLDAFENRIIYYESSRGCPFRCSYCLSSLEKKIRYRSIDIVKSELQYFLDHKVKQVKFIDRTFNSSSKRALEIWTYIKEHDNGVTNFHFEIGADLLTEEELQLLSCLRPGLVQLEIGIQTTYEPTMEAIHRTADNSHIFKNVETLRKAYNINLHTDLIAGLPYEDYSRFQKSFNDIYPLYADQLQLGFLKVLKGTDMYDHRHEYGLVYSSRQPYEIFATKWISYEEIVHLHKVCDAVELFYNSQMFRHSLKYLEQYFSSPFSIYESIADYLSQHKLAGIGISIKKKYDILEDFGLEHGVGEEWRLWINFDKMLHTHSSRRMTAREVFTWSEGAKSYEFNYTKMHPVTGEAEYIVI